MIKTIELSYKSNGVDEGTIVRTFFEKAGIHVIESCYDKPVDLREDLAFFGIEPVSKNLIVSDAKIILTDELDDEHISKDFDVDKIVVEIDCKNAPKDEKGVIDREWLLKSVLKQIKSPENNISGPVKINYKEVPKNEQGIIDAGWLINETLSQLSEQGLLNEKQGDHLRELAEIFVDTDYNNFLMLVSYASLLKEKKLVELAEDAFNNFAPKAAKKYRATKTNIHLGYALLDACYSMGFIKATASNTTGHLWPQIAGLADDLKRTASGVLDRKVSMILILAKYHILSNRGDAYGETLLLEGGAGRFFVDIYRFHGTYYEKEGDYEFACKFYKIALSLVPTDYESWRGISRCFEKSKHPRSASASSQAVTKILENERITGRQNLAKTLGLFRSLVSLGKTAEQRGEYLAALKYYGLAKGIIEKLKDTSYFKELNIKVGNEHLTNKLDERLGTENLERSLKCCRHNLGC